MNLTEQRGQTQEYRPSDSMKPWRETIRGGRKHTSANVLGSFSSHGTRNGLFVLGRHYWVVVTQTLHSLWPVPSTDCTNRGIDRPTSERVSPRPPASASQLWIRPAAPLHEFWRVASEVMESVPSPDGGRRLQPPHSPPGFQVAVS